MPSTIRASHPRVLVLLLVAAFLSASSASAHVPQPTTTCFFGSEHDRLDLARLELELSEKTRLGDLRARKPFYASGDLCKSLNALVDSGRLRSNSDRNVFFFQGRERDPATGLYDFRNRWYDANLARFVSFDPKPYVDGPNAYGGFVGSPVTMSDPNGEFVPLLAMIGMGMLNVGFSAAINHTFGDGDYSLMDAAQDFTIGALSGGLGTLTKGSKMLTVAAEVGVGALDSQVRSVRETGELMNFTDSVNQGAIGTLTGRVGARALGGVAKPVFKAIGKTTGVAVSRLGKALAHVRTPCKNSFVAGTEIATEHGQRPIEEVEVGDRVWAWDAAGESLELRKVLGTSHHPTGAVVRITVGDEEIVATLDHPFWVVGEGWVESAALVVGDGLLSSSGYRLEVGGIEVETRSLEVYNFEVDGLHTYFVGEPSAWVHNCPAAKTVGSGPAKGFLEVSDAYRSSKAVQNYGSARPTDFIFDPKSQRFIMGRGPHGHDSILQAGRITPNDSIVGGRIARQNGRLATDEWSGHYGQNWTPKIRQQFQSFLQQHGVDIAHTPWGR